MNRIYKIILQKLYGNLVNKKIAVLGFAFKANTNDTRESPAISICKDLLKEGSILSINDPKVDEKVINKIFNDENKNIYFCKNIYDSVKDADAVLILTDWDQYKQLDFHRLSKLMRKPAWVFDTRAVIDISEVRKTDLNFWKLGYGVSQ